MLTESAQTWDVRFRLQLSSCYLAKGRKCTDMWSVYLRHGQRAVPLLGNTTNGGAESILPRSARSLPVAFVTVSCPDGKGTGSFHDGGMR